MIRVAAVMDTIQVSGPARQLAAIARPLAALGVHQRVLAFHPASRPDTPFIRFLEAHEVDVEPVPTFGRLHPRTLTALADALRRFAPDIVQTHSYRPNLHALLLRLADRNPLPWIAFFHGFTAENLRVRAYHRLDRLVLSVPDEVILVASAQRSQLGRLRRFSVIPNAILPNPAHGRTTPTREHATVLYAGRLSHEKGVDLLLEAWKDVASRRPDATLRILGDGPERGRLQEMVDRLGLTSSVTFLEFDPEPWSHYLRASVVVLPSRSEGMPNVILEALALETPVVATRVGGIPEISGDPAALIVVEPESPTALTRGLLTALEPERTAALIPHMRAARERLSVNARAAALEATYRRIGGG